MNLKLILAILLFSCSKTEVQVESEKIENQKIELPSLNFPKGVQADEVAWDENTKTLSFVKNCSFSDFTNQDEDKEGFYWNIPDKVDRVWIKKGVQVIGGFRSVFSVSIEGEDRATSEIFGTNSKNWSLGPDGKTDPQTSCTNGAKGDDIVHDCEKWKYGAISSEGDESVTITIQNLTITNARSYAITGFKPKFILDNVHVRNTRPVPDYHSNSDGISAGPGSIVRNSKFDVWDDAIKLYRDMTVENVTIIHNSNGAPFQFGWGAGIKESTHSLKNILILANNKNHSNLALFSASLTSGAIVRRVRIEGIKAIYNLEQKVRNEQPMPLIWVKSPDSKIDFTFFEPYHLQAPLQSLGGIVNGLPEKLIMGNTEKITGCGF